MSTRHDIVIISLQAWDIGIGSNCKDIALELSKRHRVLYVNSPLDRISRFRERERPEIRKRIDILRGKGEDLVQVNENLWTLYPRTILESISRLPWNWLFDRINLENNRRFAEEIRSAVRRLDFSNFILFNDGNMFRGLHLPEMIRPALSAYYYRDHFTAMEFWKRQGTRIQPRIMSGSDIILANSEFLARDAGKYNPRSFVVGQGFDDKVYNRQNASEIPDDLLDIPRPVIGYAGALLSLRLDPEILSHISVERPDWNIVLVGPEDSTFRNSDLHLRPNVHFLGLKRPDQIPAYIKHFDVAINPQRVNEVTLGNYPRKIDEYLGMGKPVVATRTEFMSMFSQFASLADSPEEYVPLIEKALRENSPSLEAKREAFAMSHNWENNVANMMAILEKRMYEIKQNEK